MTELFEQSPFDPAKERRIVIIADWLPPDFGAVGQYMQMRAQGLAEQGHDVTLVGLSTGSGSKSRQERGKGSLTEIRLSARPVPRGSLLGRMLWTIVTNLRLILAAFGPLRAADGILFTGSPPFLIHLLVPLKLLWRGRLIYRITDFHPECLIAARDRPSRALRLLMGLTNFWRRRVDGFEVLGEDQRRRLNVTGVPAGRIALVRDGSPVTFVPVWSGRAPCLRNSPASACCSIRATTALPMRSRPSCAATSYITGEEAGAFTCGYLPQGPVPRRLPAGSGPPGCRSIGHLPWCWRSWPACSERRQRTS